MQYRMEESSLASGHNYCLRSVIWRICTFVTVCGFGWHFPIACGFRHGFGFSCSGCATTFYIILCHLKCHFVIGLWRARDFLSGDIKLLLLQILNFCRRMSTYMLVIGFGRLVTPLPHVRVKGRKVMTTRCHIL